MIVWNCGRRYICLSISHLWTWWFKPSFSSVSSLVSPFFCMQTLRVKAGLAKKHQLFRATSASKVVAHLSLQPLWDLLGISHGSSYWESSDHWSLYDSLEPVTEVDVFISHSWSCPSWIKALAVCHYLNLDLAILSACLATLLSVSILVFTAGSFSGVAQQSQGLLFSCLICWPVVSFLIPYLFGHTAFVRKSFWIDQVCVDQEKKETKAKILEAIPAFVAHSAQMLVLWDSTYFERLWCNYELAVHAKTFVSEDATQLVPMWMPLWTLSWFSIASLTSSLAVGQQSPQLDLESRRSLFLSAFNSNFVPFFVYLLSALPFSWFCLRKIQSHKLMLDQMSQFNLRHVNCSLDSDRKLIEEQVLQLFDEALAPPVQVCFCAGAHEDYDDHEVLVSPEDIQEIRHITSYPSGIEVLDQFNAYVRGSLSDIVLRSVGKEQSISCKLCFVVSFPLWLLGLVVVLGCDGRSECETSAMYAGYGTVSEYMASNAAINLLFQPLVNVLGLPLMLWANHLTTTCFSAYSLQILIGSVLSGLVLKLMDNLFFAQRGMLIVVVTRFSTTWLAGLIASVILELVLFWLLFLRSWRHQHVRTVACVT